MGPAKGHIFIMSAPSGAGKTTLCRALLDHYPDMAYSVSFTTRRPRPGEREGVDYHFTSAAAFEEGIRKNRWAEWAKVHGHYYGTDAGTLACAVNQGTDILLDIDVQGTRQLLSRFPAAVTLFVMPPSIDVLRQRLEDRGGDSHQVIEGRLASAEEEMRHRGLYRHVIVNDRLADAIGELLSIVGGYRQKDDPACRQKPGGDG